MTVSSCHQFSRVRPFMKQLTKCRTFASELPRSGLLCIPSVVFANSQSRNLSFSSNGNGRKEPALLSCLQPSKEVFILWWDSPTWVYFKHLVAGNRWVVLSKCQVPVPVPYTLSVQSEYWLWISQVAFIFLVLLKLVHKGDTHWRVSWGQISALWFAQCFWYLILNLLNMLLGQCP